MIKHLKKSIFFCIIFIALSNGCAIKKIRIDKTECRVDPQLLPPYPRLGYLEKAHVGALPKELTLFTCLAHFNKRVAEEKLPRECEIWVTAQPEELLREHITMPFNDPARLKLILGREKGKLRFNDKEPFLTQVEKLNLAQFLWLISVIYQGDVSYKRFGIVVSYGVAPTTGVPLKEFSKTPISDPIINPAPVPGNN